MAGLVNSNPRARRLVGILGMILAVVVIIGVPIGMELLVRARRADTEELKQALSDVQDARGKLRDRQAKKDAISSRYAKRAPSLAGYIEQTARAQKLDVTDSVDRPEVPVGNGKRYIERSTTVHLKKAGMYAISKFLEGIEKSGNAVAVTRLGIRKRTGEPDSYDVEVGISAYDRIEKPAAPEPDKDKKP